MARALKSEIRLIGFDDASFDKFKDKQTLLIGTIYRGGSFMDGVVSSLVDIDGDNATSVMVKLVNSCKFRPQLRCILLDGIAVGGFNVVDVQQLSKETRLPVLVVMRDYPDIKKIKAALTKLGMKDKIMLLENAGRIEKINKVHVQRVGLTQEQAQEILQISCTHAHIPEPLRIAHLIGQGIAMGESKGRA